MYTINPTDSKSALLRERKRVFTTNDLAVVWGIENRNTLRTKIARYLENKTLYGIQRGLYATLPVQNIDAFVLAGAVGGPFSYISLESVLQKHGVIFQSVVPVTVVSEKSFRKEISNLEIRSRKLSQKYLLNRFGISDELDYSEATLSRAVADILYFNSKYYFDNPSSIDWEAVKQIQREVGYI